VPTLTAFAVTNLQEQHLADLVDYDFTARMEDGLDAIANGDHETAPWLRDFYFGGHNGANGGANQVARMGLKALLGTAGEHIDARQVCSVELGRNPDGDVISARVGRYGPYVQVGDSTARATIPDDIPLDELTVDKASELLHQAAQGDQQLGVDPETNKPVYLKSGRFGPYVQLGDPELTEKGAIKKGSKPKMASLWPSMAMETITLAEALQLLSYPKTLGAFPDSGEPITAQDGKFGPYLKAGKETRSLENHEQLATITLEEAIALLRQPKRGRRTTSNTVMAELGTHPDTELPLQVKNGRFGPYVTDGVVNATIPKGQDPEKVTFEKAVELIAAREDKLRSQGKDPRAPKAKKKTSARSAKTKTKTKTKTKKTSAPKKTPTKKKAAKKTTRKRAAARSSS
jgi:DNA topoisomerase-1